MTPTEIKLFTQLRDQPTLMSKILQLKVTGMTHQQIGDELGYSKGYINNVFSRESRKLKAHLERG